MLLFNKNNFFSSYVNYVTINQDLFVSKDDFNTLKNDVINNRPGTILYNNNNEKYGTHYVTTVGYLEDVYGQRFYIIHDLWNTTPVNVYKNWDNDVYTNDVIWGYYQVIPK